MSPGQAAAVGIGALALGGLGLGLAAVASRGDARWRRPTARPSPSRAPTSPPSPRQDPAPAAGAEAREVEALARMMRSETSHRGTQVVVGWLVVQAARRRGLSVHRLLTGRSGEYGPQKHKGEIRKASTAKEATDELRDRARRLLAGDLQPSAAVRALGTALSFVEDLGPSYPAEKVLAQQKRFGGIVARLRETKWYLFRDHAPIVVAKGPGRAAAQAALAQVPVVDAVEREVA